MDSSRALTGLCALLLAVGAGAEAFALAAAWSLASVLIQAVRLVQGLTAHRREKLTSWMM